MATVRDYLNWYRKASNEERGKGSTLFGEYIISACWQKMERRIGHWAAVGLIYNLCKIRDESLLHLHKDETSAASIERPDFKLSIYLQFMGKNEYLEKTLKFHRYTIPSHSIPQDPSGRLTVLPQLQRLCHDRSYKLYRKETVAEFHHLLVATILSYASGLRDLRIGHMLRRRREETNSNEEKKAAKELTSFRKREAKKLKVASKTGSQLDLQGSMAAFKSFEGEEEEEEEEGVEEEEEEAKRKDKEEEEEAKREEECREKSPEERIDDAARGLYFSSRLLNAILTSGAFQTHIKHLVEEQLLKIPSDTNQRDYQKFSADKNIPWQQSRATQTGVLQNHEKSEVNPDFEGTSSSREGDQDPFSITENEGAIMAIQGWVKLFVQHLHAKSILESFAKNGGRDIPIDIKVYGVSPPEQPLPYPTQADLESIIRSSLQDTPDMDKMIAVFLSHFQSDDMAGKNKIFSVIRNIIMGRARKGRYYNMHCEAALAGLVSASKYPETVAPYADKGIVDELNVGCLSSI